jgi:hypothetical protein
VDKAAGEKGLYLHPEAFGQPAAKGIGNETRQQLSALEAVTAQAKGGKQ